MRLLGFWHLWCNVFESACCLVRCFYMDSSDLSISEMDSAVGLYEMYF